MLRLPPRLVRCQPCPIPPFNELGTRTTLSCSGNRFFRNIMTSSSAFKLASTATAIAIVPPHHLHADINSLRKVHDKAYHKWQPHINLIYPFVEPTQLMAAISILRQHLLDHPFQALPVDLDRVDTFTHRRNATVFLRPSQGTESMICKMRSALLNALDCKDSDGTHDGTFRPHMTIGQAGLNGTQLQRLSDKVSGLTGITWESKNLIVLEREPTGEMKMVEELPFTVYSNQKSLVSASTPDS